MPQSSPRMRMPKAYLRGCLAPPEQFKFKLRAGVAEVQQGLSAELGAPGRGSCKVHTALAALVWSRQSLTSLVSAHCTIRLGIPHGTCYMQRTLLLQQSYPPTCRLPPYCPIPWTPTLMPVALRPSASRLTSSSSGSIASSRGGSPPARVCGGSCAMQKWQPFR